MVDRKGMIVVCGVPRSGTSLCMDIQRVAHGNEYIVGDKFPQERGQAPDHIKAIRNYLNPHKHDYKDMNPDGFWECNFTVKGIIYTPQMRHILKDVADGHKRICKVVCSGLLASDPQYISKIIFTLRDPHSVAKSQERLQRQFDFQQELEIHTPEMFINNLVQASRFFLMYPEVPVMFYNFDDLISAPKSVTYRMQEFINDGDYSQAHNQVKPKLNRSKNHDHIDNPLFADAEYIYELFQQRKFKEVITYISDPKRQTNREKKNWPCPRAGMQVNNILCRQCTDDINVRKNIKQGAIKRRVKWQDKPCLFECGMDVDRTEFITIEQSIQSNTWADTPNILHDIKEQQDVLDRMIQENRKDCEIERQRQWVAMLREGQSG